MDRAARPPRIAVVADDLIWATRLADSVLAAGGEPVPVRTLRALVDVLPGAHGCIVDLTARAYDGIATIRAATGSGVPVIAVAQHDDAVMRRSARSAGATRVYAYRRLFERGSTELGAWIGSLAAQEVRG